MGSVRNSMERSSQILLSFCVLSGNSQVLSGHPICSKSLISSNAVLSIDILNTSISFSHLNFILLLQMKRISQAQKPFSKITSGPRQGKVSDRLAARSLRRP